MNGMSFSPDGKTLYISGKNDAPTILAFDLASRNIVWTFGEGYLDYEAQPLVDVQGNIYFLSQNNEQGSLFSVNKEGAIRWIYDLGPYAYIENYPKLFTMDRDGNIYLGKDELISVDYNGKLRWKYKPEGEYLDISSPIVSDENNIFFTSKLGTEKELFSIDTKGELNWRLSLPEENSLYVSFCPTIANNAIYITSYKSTIIKRIK